MPGRGRSWRGVGEGNPDRIGTDEVDDSTIQAEDLSVFKSTEITGTGSDQNIAHGLGRTPSLVWWSISLQGDTDTVIEGATDATNVVLNFPATTKLFVYAL